MSVGRILHSGGASLGIELSSRQIELLDRYVGLVMEWGARLNVSGVTTKEEAARVLVLEGLACLPPLPQRGTLVDLGSGPGTPGIPIAVARPELRVTLVESSRKKAGFLAVVLRELGLVNAEVVHARAEDVGRGPAHRERHDAVTARALAALPVLAEYALPLLRVGGIAVFPKARRAPEEVARAAGAVARLGGAPGVEVRRLPSGGDLIVVRKVAPTPDRYPRRPGLPARRPLS